MSACSQVLPWGSVCWPTAVPSRTRCSGRSWRRCAYVPPRWGCACPRARWPYPSTAPPRGSAVRGWHRPGAPDGPRYDFAAERRDTERDERPFLMPSVSWSHSLSIFIQSSLWFTKSFAKTLQIMIDITESLPALHRLSQSKYRGKEAPWWVTKCSCEREYNFLLSVNHKKKTKGTMKWS